MNSNELKFQAFLDHFHTITILLPKDYHYGSSSAFYIDGPQLTQELIIVNMTYLHSYIKYECHLPIEIPLRFPHTIRDEHNTKTILQIGAIIRTVEFDERFYYDGNDLGVIYTEQSSSFKVWAPTALQGEVILLNDKKESIGLYPLEREEKGTWQVTIHHDCDGCFYLYRLHVNGKTVEVVDPYVKSLSINSEYGAIINLEKTRERKNIPLQTIQKATDAIIYEAHVRDFTIHAASGVEANKKGLYNGFTAQTVFHSSGEKTNLQYVKDLGYTHIELLPVNDYGGVDEEKPFESYNWGYNPLYFFAPEGSYSTNPRDPYARIRELKELIAQCHEAGLGVILDVVFNHVYVQEESSFEKILPGYYFRHDQYGMPTNGTGVGNDIASERKMVRKFIVDCVLYWAEEYGIDGFRFDLMGILDVGTMNELHHRLQVKNPHILVFGEGWDLNTPLAWHQKAKTSNAKLMPKVGFFNDFFREYVKGSAFDVHQKGYAFGDISKKYAVEEAVLGSITVGGQRGNMFINPIQSINYAECHDNYTLWDKLQMSTPNEKEEILKQRHLLATSFVVFSQGVPFLHAGQEFFRTKNGHHNSYNELDHINALDWDQAIAEKESVQRVKWWLSVRKAHGAFRFGTGKEVLEHATFLQHSTCILYHLHDVENYGPARHTLIAWNVLDQEQTYALPAVEGVWKEMEQGNEPFHSGSECNGEQIIPPFTVKMYYVS